MKKCIKFDRHYNKIEIIYIQYYECFNKHSVPIIKLRQRQRQD